MHKEWSEILGNWLCRNILFLRNYEEFVKIKKCWWGDKYFDNIWKEGLIGQKF